MWIIERVLKHTVVQVNSTVYVIHFEVKLESDWWQLSSFIRPTKKPLEQKNSIYVYRNESFKN